MATEFGYTIKRLDKVRDAVTHLIEERQVLIDKANKYAKLYDTFEQREAARERVLESLQKELDGLKEQIRTKDTPSAKESEDIVQV